ncbi:MAG: NlpC/P60 family protein, partial [Actinomycetota bacterium]
AAAKAAAAAQARADARDRAARDAARGSVTSGSGSGSDGQSQSPPPSSGNVSAVIAFARKQIGDPYVWGAAGPNTWDCSGLTQQAWAQAGVYLSHYTGYQWNETSRVPLSDLQPGDLVFFGADGPSSHHVGLYVGNGRMIEAPYTGALVRESSIWRSDTLPYGGRP